MLKRYSLVQNMLRNAQHLNDGDAKIDEYREAMENITLLRDRRGGARPLQPKRAVTKNSVTIKAMKGIQQR